MSFAEAAAEQTDQITLGAIIAAIVGYLATLLLIRWVLLTKKRYSSSSVAWILIIIMLPILGGVLFLLFGVNKVERRKKQRSESLRRFDSDVPNLSQFHTLPTDDVAPQVRQLMRLSKRIGGTSPTGGNRIELLDDTNRALGLIEQAIHAAEKSIHLEYYIWQPDKTGSRVRDLLIQKANEGVTIRFLYDQLGSMRLSRKFLRPMRDAGIHIAPFLPGQSLRERFSFNLRSHRKIVIADGRVGFTGGMNIGDEYLGRNKKLGYWRDTHLRMTGPTVLQLQHVFAEDWYFATGEELTDAGLYPLPESNGQVTAQVLAGEPSGDVDVFYTLMFAAINEAQERITLATSYFVPPSALATALETAAMRGVKVRLLLTGRSANPATLFAARSYYDSLLTAGVEIHEYARGLLHSKTLTIDGRWSLVGTPNFDARSLILNFEVAVAMYDAGIALELEEQYNADLKWSQRITPEDRAKVKRWRILVENTARLFAPVL